MAGCWSVHVCTHFVPPSSGGHTRLFLCCMLARTSPILESCHMYSVYIYYLHVHIDAHANCLFVGMLCYSVSNMLVLFREKNLHISK